MGDDCWLGDSMFRQSMEAVKGLVSRQDFLCLKKGCLNERIFQSQHKLLSHNREWA